jgi:hypothetical protein
MKIETLRITNFRCFGPAGIEIQLDEQLTAFVGGNGCGKTAAFQALSRLFGVTPAQRTVRRQDFHLPASEEELPPGTTLSIEVEFSFPELLTADDRSVDNAVPEFFSQMCATAPGAPPKARIRLQATWTDDGTPDGSIDEDLRWVTTLDDDYKWEDCKRVHPVERGSVQLIYVPATRDALGQVTALLKGRLWRAAKWSDEFQEEAAQSADNIQGHFAREKPARFISDKLERRWRQLHAANTDTSPYLRLVESRFDELVRRAEFAFSPGPSGQDRTLADLSDGQRSLFHIALTATTLDVEQNALLLPVQNGLFDQEKLRSTCLTFLAIEEPENSLSPYFLSRIITQARQIGAMTSAQVALSSHSPAILSRVEPKEVRHFRLDNGARLASVRRLTLPKDDEEASKYIRLAITAYPELYFARFVVLCEGVSEHIIIPRIAEARRIQLDPSFVPVVPLGGRYVTHFWRLLNDLDIPHATLLDLDIGRAHGGAALIADVISKLSETGQSLDDNSIVSKGEIDPNRVIDIADGDLLAQAHDHPWLRALREEGVFFSFPIDVDFSMLRAFPAAYEHPHPGGQGPRADPNAIREKVLVTLKTGGKPELYGDTYDDQFKWYPYLFLNRSKPETHVAALARLKADDLIQNAPPELSSLIQRVADALGIQIQSE